MSLSFLPPGFNEDAVYELKYQILSKRCVEVKKETDKIYERLLQCKRMLGKVLYERRALRDKLERQYHDKLSDSEIPVFREEDFAYEVLATQKQACPNSANSSSSNDIALPDQSFTMSQLGKRSKMASQLLVLNDGNSSNYSNNSTPVNSCNSSNGNRRTAKAKTGKKNSVSNGNGGTAGSSTSAKKDPDAPRKPVNAYFIFCEKKRSLVQMQLSHEQSGEVDRKEVTRRLGQMWGALTDDEKSIYFDEYRKDKERYGIEMEEYAILKQRPLGLDESGSFMSADQFAASTSSFCSNAGPSKPKKAKRSKSNKLKSNCRTTPNNFIPSSASSPFLMPNTTVSSSIVTQQDDSAMLLPCAVNSSSAGYEDFFKGVVVKMESQQMGGAYYYGQMDNLSSPSSLTPTIGGEHYHAFDRLEPSPLASYVPPPPPLFVNASEDASDEVFLSSSSAQLQHHHHLNNNNIESSSPGVATIANLSSGEGGFEMLQQSFNMHSVAMQQLLFHHQSEINEMPVP